jgi:LuxR family maltose regulon positive regulatory protein
MSIPLLENKIVIPPLPPRAIPRTHLIGRLNAGLRAGHHLTVVSAPAGYGKTVLVSAWARSADRPFAWLTLERDDNDPVRFATCLAAALRQVGSAIRPGALRMLSAAPVPATQSFMPALAGDLAAAPTGSRSCWTTFTSSNLRISMRVLPIFLIVCPLRYTLFS